MSDTTLERDLAGRETIQQLLDAAGMNDCEHVIDYGGGRGVWSQGFPRSTVFEPYADEWGPELPGRVYTGRTDGIPQADGILLIAVQQYLLGGALRDFFAFAREHLTEDGRLLATVTSPLLMAEWALTGSRRKYDGWRGQLFWARNALLPNGYAIRRREFVQLAAEHDLRLVDELPRALDHAYWRMQGDRVRGRGYHWLVFEPK